MAGTVDEVREAISNHISALAEQIGKAIVAGHRVAARGVHWKPGVIVTASHLVRRAAEVNVLLQKQHFKSDKDHEPCLRSRLGVLDELCA